MSVVHEHVCREVQAREDVGAARTIRAVGEDVGLRAGRLYPSHECTIHGHARREQLIRELQPNLLSVWTPHTAAALLTTLYPPSRMSCAVASTSNASSSESESGAIEPPSISTSASIACVAGAKKASADIVLVVWVITGRVRFLFNFHQLCEH